jgi:isopropylmalate/homocitrate/citramalate synthase
MSRDRLYLFDTTLRDGAQTAGIEFSLEDKIAIIDLLEELGLDYVEGGYPGLFRKAAHQERCFHRLRYDQKGRALRRQ